MKSKCIKKMVKSLKYKGYKVIKEVKTTFWGVTYFVNKTRIKNRLKAIKINGKCHKKYTQKPQKEIFVVFILT